ncbi:MAG TPA: PepSY-associated TM helix domain-containing protein [Pirellulales bacterium]|nr:PepSY-associated TM helix domain-containing protein [Pirellulales bacterium]
MSSTSVEQTKTTAQDGFGSAGTPPSNTRRSAAGDRLYRVVWRWHFYAGMIITLPLIVVAATGALYIFKDEVEGVLHPGVLYVEPAAERATYEQQLAAARAAVPETPRMIFLQVFTNPKRATSLAMAGEKFQFGYVDPYRGHYLGSVEKGGFSDIVLTLHRSLFLGTTGRIVVELTTCWTIVLAATGIYLWWPQKAKQVWGVWLPRLRAKPYVVLRDLHSVAGMYVAVVAIVISLTGLIYTYVWGRGFQYAAQKTEAYDMFSKPMLSKSPPEAKDVSMDRIVETAQQRMPGNNLTVWFPRAPNAVYLVTANNERGPGVNEILFIDRASGEVLEDRYNSQTKTMYWLGTWNYPLHVGTIWGMPSKILWLVTCIVLMTLPVTGVWMWWQRRPTGRLGLPRRVDSARPRWLVLTVTATSILLPAVGLSVVVLLVGELLVARLRKR